MRGCVFGQAAATVQWLAEDAYSTATLAFLGQGGRGFGAGIAQAVNRVKIRLSGPEKRLLHTYVPPGAGAYWYDNNSCETRRLWQRCQLGRQPARRPRTRSRLHTIDAIKNTAALVQATD
jgi:hypothetical protein